MLIRPRGRREEQALAMEGHARNARVLHPAPALEGLARGEAAGANPSQARNQMARNRTNEKIHPPRIAMKIQLQLKSKARNRAVEKRLRANGHAWHLV